MPCFRLMFFVCLGIALFSVAGCQPQDPNAELKAAFEELKSATDHVDELLASIHDVESAKAVMEDVKAGRAKMRDAGVKVMQHTKNHSRSAVSLINEIDAYRRAREVRFPAELRRLNAIPGVEPIVTKAMSEDDNRPELAPLPGS